ncbi:hypothetical protein [Micropruina sp.]|uniref:hypothetical protein n=1 Tax=Micropruina sp. TaxID=2737536 RepID=UPI0039E62E35
MSSTEYREREPFTQAAAGPLTAWRRHWLMGTVVALTIALVGVAAGFVAPTVHTAEARVAVGAGDLSAGAVAGFPAASSSLASNYARYVNDRGVAQTDIPDGVTLSASQIPESNVIRIEAASADPAAATAAANSAADQLVTLVNTGGRQSIEDVFKQFTKASKDDAKAQTELAAAQHQLDLLLSDTESKKGSLNRARDAVTKAAGTAGETSAKAAALRQKYTNLVDGSQTAGNLLVIRTADTPTTNRISLVSRLGLIGLIIGAAGGLAIAVALERRRAPVANQKAPVLDGE